MKIALMSGAYSNAGDFLIEKRAISIIKSVIPSIQWDMYKRNEFGSRIEEIEKNDVIVFGGGPIFMNELDTYLGLDQVKNRKLSNVMIIGGGWYGIGGGYKVINNYSFSAKTKNFLDMVEKNGFGMGARDIYTYHILRQNKYNKVHLTGCPAWYDLNYINNTQLQNDSWEIRKVCVSDPADPKNYILLPKIINYINGRFPSAEITLVFHRGISTAYSYLAELNKEIVDKLQIVDISGREDGFLVYNDADLHIGFRVHAHIYCLSIRRKTILIEEDGRGAGVNETLGIPSILAYDDSIQISGTFWGKVERKIRPRNQKVIENIDSHIQIMKETNNMHLKNAFIIQKKCYENMVGFIKHSLSG